MGKVQERPREKSAPSKRRGGHFMSRAELRRHNAPRVQWWLEGYTDRFPAGAQEVLRIDGRKLEGRILLNKALTDILKDEHLRYSDSVMLKLVFQRMPREKPRLYDALFRSYLSPSFSLGDLDIIGKAAARGDDEAADFLIDLYAARAWLIEQLGKWQDPGSDEEGHWLEVEKGERARSLREAAFQDQRKQTEEAYRGIYASYRQALDELGLPSMQAKRHAGEIWGKGIRTVETAIRFCET